jgi:hypothetical protein
VYFNAICKDNVAINCIIVQHKEKVSFQSSLTLVFVLLSCLQYSPFLESSCWATTDFALRKKSMSTAVS